MKLPGDAPVQLPNNVDAGLCAEAGVYISMDCLQVPGSPTRYLLSRGKYTRPVRISLNARLRL